MLLNLLILSSGKTDQKYNTGVFMSSNIVHNEKSDVYIYGVNM